MRYQGVIRQYHEFLPVSTGAIVSLNEGNTPLIRAPRIEHKLKLPCPLYFKYEGLNPTASFKDRGMTYAISKAVEKGARAVICASTGNTSASAAAYAARAGLKCVVLIPRGNIAYGKLSQAMIHGADVIQINGNFDEALRIVQELAQQEPIEIVNSINPHRITGQKTAAYEIIEALGHAPTHHFLPVGNAGNITAYWAGYQEWYRLNKSRRLPIMFGYQASGAAPIVLNRVISQPKTLASAIRIGNPASWQGALLARDESRGIIDKVKDTEIVTAYQLIASLEGIFCEPASAVSLAGVIHRQKRSPFKKSHVIVCTLTGHGLKDPDLAIKYSRPAKSAPAQLGAIRKLIRLK